DRTPYNGPKPDGTYFSYGFNYSAGGPLYDANGDLASVAPRTRTRVRSPSEFILVADAAADGCRDFAVSGYAARPNPAEYLLTVGNVHRGGANVLFADGHVQW